MGNSSAIAMLGWLIGAVGAGIIAIALTTKKATVKSHTRRVADVLSGAGFCLMGAAFIVSDDSGQTLKVLIGAAVLVWLSSWYLGRHARKFDRPKREKH